MASIQEDVTRQTWELLLKFMGTGAEFVYQIAHEGNVLLKQGSNFTNEFLNALINRGKKRGEPTDVLSKMLERGRKGETIHTTPIPDEDAEDLVRRLEDNRIVFHLVDNPNDDTKIFMYMSDDVERFAEILSVSQAEKGLVSELNPDLFLDHYAQEGVGTLSGLDLADLALFREYAKDNGLVFATTRMSENDKFMVIYDPKDKTAVLKTMSATTWAFAGMDGAKLREQVVVFQKNRQQLNRSLLDAEKEYYIVSGKVPENYVHITAEDFAYYKDTKEITKVARSSDGFMERGLRAIDGLEQPVLLSKEEFEQINGLGERDKEAVARIVAERAAVLPNMDDARNLQDRQNERLERIQEKMALDDEGNSSFWIFENSIDFNEGVGYETLEDMDSQTRADVMDARARALRYSFHEVNAVDTRSLDYFIAEAEKQRSKPSPENQRDERDR